MNKSYPDWLSLQIALWTHMIRTELWPEKTYPVFLHVTQSASDSHGCHINYNLCPRHKLVLNRAGVTIEQPGFEHWSESLCRVLGKNLRI